ncbi:ubiquinone biosynthesis protein [Siphonobacter sp. SORGH_AS_0500]|uniref:class I SAM-dependent methyltransferase n=1 Tax=Siphonobacter sp. SORGH_AS_0500 TaxID=1864824 RepID=UPI000CB71369|nr:class I SAM-dependent methyltransferase [Siphonobacter sp. SORGH_AS_0500]PKK37134.1 ubiquinone biosynthesis protein [Siphonobacter sp. SORGH_AS_0500]
MPDIYEPDYVKELFNQMSGSYERMNYITSFGFSIRWRKQFLRKLGASQEPIQIIDLLSGLGENWEFLHKNFPKADIWALDFSEKMVRQSQLKNARKFDNKIQITCQNILANQLPTGYFDYVSCAYGLKTFNQEQLQILAKEVTRILKPGGVFTFVEVSKPSNKMLALLYKFYLGKVIPILGKLFLGNPEDYRMLWIYTEKFKNTSYVKQVFEEAGLEVRHEPYFFGCASGLSGRK